jgi:hypothetical protein
MTMTARADEQMLFGFTVIFFLHRDPIRFAPTPGTPFTLFWISAEH